MVSRKVLGKEKSRWRVAPGFASRGFDPRPELQVWGMPPVFETGRHPADAFSMPSKLLPDTCFIHSTRNTLYPYPDSRKSKNWSNFVSFMEAAMLRMLAKTGRFSRRPSSILATKEKGKHSLQSRRVHNTASSSNARFGSEVHENGSCAWLTAFRATSHP